MEPEPSEQETTPPLEVEPTSEEAMAVEEGVEPAVAMATESSVQVQETSSTNMADTTTVTMATIPVEEQGSGQAGSSSPREAEMEAVSEPVVAIVPSEEDREGHSHDMNEVSSGDNEELIVNEGPCLGVCLSVCLFV